MGKRVSGGEEDLPLVSLVVPCLGDPGAVDERARRWAGMAGAGEVEVILVGVGGERKKGEAGVRWVWVGRPSRGGQLRAGAEAARGGLVVFHHADNPLEEGHVGALLEAARDPEVEGGAFQRDFGYCWPGLAWLSPACRWWERHFGILYGDQTCFVKREAYGRIGGMPDISLMEDVEFSARLRRGAKVRLLGPPVRPDRSRFRIEGRVRRRLGNLWLLFLYRLGASPDALYERYYQRGAYQ